MYKTARNLTVLGVVLGISAAVGWLLLRESKREKTPATMTVSSQHRNEAEQMPKIVLPLEPLDDDSSAVEATGAELDTDSVTPDDLTQINDIGPRFAEALGAIGITSFKQLAAQTPDALAEKLTPHVTVRAQRIRDKDWIGQAAQLTQQ